jgi:hypothetical protein
MTRSRSRRAHVLSWQGRFDDPRTTLPTTARFRTLYLARRRRTAVLETLQDLRPSTKDQADFQSLFGATAPTPILPRRWRADRRVGRARLDEGERRIVDLEDLEVRRALEERHAALLAAYGMRNLDISQLRSSQRIVTQTIALDLHGQGCAGIAYKSNLDGQGCVAIFEGRVEVHRYGAAQAIPADDDDLTAVCGAWGITIE